MTREEKIEHMVNEFKKIHPLVEDNEIDIFRDATRVMHDAMLLEFESRICENCKYYGSTKFSSNNSCQIEVSVSYYNNNHPKFGCNKFEPKLT